MLQRGVGAGSGAGSAQDEAPQAGALYPEAGREEVVAAQHEAERLHQIVQGPPHCAHATQLDGGGALALRHLLRRGLRGATGRRGRPSVSMPQAQIAAAWTIAGAREVRGVCNRHACALLREAAVSGIGGKREGNGPKGGQ